MNRKHLSNTSKVSDIFKSYSETGNSCHTNAAKLDT